MGKANLRQRDKMVGSKRSRLFEDSKNKVPGGGSSRVFSKAFEAGVFSASAGYSTTTRKPWRWVEIFMKSANARICSILISLDGALDLAAFLLSPSPSSPSPAGSSSMDSGRMRR